MKRYNRLFTTAISFALSLGTSISAVQAAELSLSTVPLFVKDGVDPNLIVTLDDSGSMAFAYVPDALGGEVDIDIDGDGTTNYGYFLPKSRQFKSSSRNPMYYDPNTVYLAPKKADGSAYTTSFTKAWRNGFVPNTSGNGLNHSSNFLDLSNNYHVSGRTKPSGKGSLGSVKWSSTTSSSWRAPHPWQEFGDHNGTTDDPIVSKNKQSSGVHAYYYVYNENSNNCNKTKEDDDCYDYVKVDDYNSTNNKQNFANWYSFYRTRVLATASASSLAFQTVSEDVRVAWQNLHKCNGFDTSCRDWRNSSSYQVDSRIRTFTGNHKTDFFQWLQYAPASGGTPLRNAIDRAGDLIKTDDINSPYAKNPGVTKDPMYECRGSFHIAMTDGLWNGSTPSGYGDYDSSGTKETPGGCTGNDCKNGYKAKYPKKTYTPMSPFKDNTKDSSGNAVTVSDSVADIILKQWMEDAQPDIPDQVPTFIKEPNDDEDIEFWNPKNDPAEWQHMTTYTVGFGLTTSLTDPNFTTEGTFGGDYDAIVAGTKFWPKVSDNSANNPYDLWHGAINGRGEFFGVDDPNSLVSAFQSIIAGIQERDASAAAVALDSGIANGLDYAYHAQFFASDWSGDLRAFQLLPPYFTASSTVSWSAQAQLNTRTASRNIKMADSSGALVDFKYSNMTASQKALMSIDVSGNTDTKGSDRVEFIRGDKSKEGSDFRDRGGKLLGDIIHSSPVYVGPPTRFGYDELENITVDPYATPAVIPANSYHQFKATHASRTPLVFVGANDGMLHAFDATTGDETFAFVPTEVIPKLRLLTNKGYSHQYYVDGSSTVADVYDGTKWRTILVGTLRSGGKSVFALDVTTPNNIQLLWEFTDADLGFTYSKPVVSRLHNGKWGVLVGNGYNSTNQKAVMYVLDAVSGSVIKKMDTGAGSSAQPNGLAVPSPVDINGDLIIDYVYAGDLHGNVWRFDLIDTSLDPAIHEDSDPLAKRPRENAAADKWSIGYGGTPLFTAKDDLTPATPQPITTNIIATPHSSGTGIIVMFGTGKYLEASDAAADTAHVQSYYGIWDRYILGEQTTSSTLTTITRSNLHKQSMKAAVTEDYTYTEYDASGNATGTVSTSSTTREVTQDDVAWFDYSTSPATLNKQGWYIDFIEGTTDRGELLATDSVLVGGQAVFATTIPNANPCDAGVDRWVWALDAQTGGRTNVPAFDLNNDNQINELDKDSDKVVNSSYETEGFGAVSAVGDRIYLNMEKTIESELLGIDGNNQRRTWRVME